MHHDTQIEAGDLVTHIASLTNTTDTVPRAIVINGTFAPSTTFDKAGAGPMDILT